MGLIDLLRGNAEYVADRPLIMAAASARPTLVIAAACPQLGGALESALGLTPGSAVVVGLAGAWGGREGEELTRSLVLGLYVHGCDEIVVVGSDAATDCPPSRKQVREAIVRAGVTTESPTGEALADLARGPGSARAGVLDSVRLLRNSPLVPDSVPVHGCLLRAASGLLEVIDRDLRGRRSEPAVVRGPVAASPLPDFPLPELPEIVLPEIPDLDLDSLAALAAPEQRAGKQPAKGRDKARQTARPGAEYGTLGGGLGGLPELHQMSESQASLGPMIASRGMSNLVVPTITTAQVNFIIPETAAIQDTGMGSYEAMLPGQPEPPSPPGDQIADVQARPDVKARDGVELQASPTPPRRPKPAPARKPERPQVTPIVGRPQPQAPLGERVIEFVEPVPEPTRKPATGPRVDLKAGFVAKDGTEFPLDPELQRALLKVTRFLAAEFASVDRSQIMGRIRRAANQGQQTGELLKMMIGPVLKLGKKRYAVINELLKIKEELPRQAPDVALALLEEILTDR